MTITLPDIPDASPLAPAEVRLELGCALYARGRVGKIAAAEMAGVDFFTFQRALEGAHPALYRANAGRRPPNLEHLVSRVIVVADTSVVINLWCVGQGDLD